MLPFFRAVRALLVFVGLLGLTPSWAGNAAAYTVGVGDVVHVEVYGETLLSGDLTVNTACELTLALVGSLHVCDLTTTALEAAITEAYRGDYLLSPVISVRVAEYRSHKVDMLGEVERRGPIYLRGPTTLLEVLSLSGGPKDENAVDIEVISESGASRKYRLRDLAVEPDKVWVHGGDTVYVQPGDVVYLEGEVTRPGVVGLVDGLTVTKALALAGGPTTYANLRRVLVRGADGSQERVNVLRVHRGVAEDVQLKADDHVLVPSGPF